MDTAKLSKFFQAEDKHFKANYKKWLEECRFDQSCELKQLPSVVIDEAGED